MTDLPRTCCVDVRCDVRILAAIARFYVTNGAILQYRSTVVRQCLEDFATLIAKTHPEVTFESTAAADAWLAANGFSRGRKDVNRMGRSYLSQLHSEQLVDTAMDSLAPVVPDPKTVEIDEEMLKTAMDNLEGLTDND